MDFQNETLEACRAALIRDPHVKRCFEKLEGSSSWGFLYEYERDGRQILMDLHLRKTLPLLTLYAHADVRVKRETIRAAAKYCQRNSDPREPGMLVVSPNSRHVFFRITTPVAEAPVSADTLNWMNNCAFEKMARCREELACLAAEEWPDLQRIGRRETSPEPEQPPLPAAYLQETQNRLMRELESPRRISFSRNLDPEGRTLFFSQLMAGGEIFHEEFILDKSGCLLLAIRPEIRVDQQLRERLILFCNEIGSDRRLAGPHAFSPDGFLWFSCSISLRDGPVGAPSVELVEALGLRELTEALRKVLDRSEERRSGPESFFSYYEDPVEAEDDELPTGPLREGPWEMPLNQADAQPSEPEEAPDFDLADPFADIFAGARSGEDTAPPLSIFSEGGDWIAPSGDIPEP